MGKEAIEPARVAAKAEGEDVVWECQCGGLEFQIMNTGFECCNCKIIADFGDVEFDADGR